MERNRIKEHYKNIVAEDFLLLYNYQSIMQLPHMNRAVLNTSSRSFLLRKEEILNAFTACSLLVGQKSAATRARKSIATFQLRKENIIGCMATARRGKMYTLFDKVITHILPRLLSQSPQSALPSSSVRIYSGDTNRVSSSPRSEAQSVATRSGNQVKKARGQIVAKAKEEGKQLLREKNSDLQFGVKEIALFPEIENLFETLSGTQGLHIIFSFSAPRSRIAENCLFSKHSKGSVFSSAFQYPSTFS